MKFFKELKRKYNNWTVSGDGLICLWVDATTPPPTPGWYWATTAQEAISRSEQSVILVASIGQDSDSIGEQYLAGLAESPWLSPITPPKLHRANTRNAQFLNFLIQQLQSPQFSTGDEH